MKLFFSHITALEFWRHPDAPPCLDEKGAQSFGAVIWPPTAMHRQTQTDSIPQQISDLRTTDRRFRTMPSPLHVLVPDKQLRRPVDCVAWHMCTSSLPQHAFMKISTNVYVAAPETVLMNLASTLTIPQLAQIGLEICGKYRLSKTDEEGFIHAEAIATPRTIGQFVEMVQGVKGSSMLVKAVPYILSGSESPMETVLYLLLCLPRRIGGYGLPRCEMNREILCKVPVGSNVRYQARRCDLYWPDAKLGIEYDSKSKHSGISSVVRDSVRRGELDFNGTSIITVTPSQVFNVFELDKVALNVAKHAGVRLRGLDNSWRTRQMDLFSQLIEWLPVAR